MSRKKRIVLFVLSILVLVATYAIWFKIEHSMDEASSYQMNSPENTSKLLIATQGSEFKNAVTNELVAHYKKDSIFIDVIDVSTLKEINPSEYDAMVLIHTWENMKSPSSVEQFIKRTSDYKDKIVVFTTSGQGTYKMKGVDAISGESILKDTTMYAEKIIYKLDSLTVLK